MKKVRVIVSGRVQGVWYRSSTLQRAVELGVHGYVRNLLDGDVEIVAEGEDLKVDSLIEWIKVGPPLARVNRINVEVLEYDDEYTDFSIGY